MVSVVLCLCHKQSLFIKLLQKGILKRRKERWSRFFDDTRSEVQDSRGRAPSTGTSVLLAFFHDKRHLTIPESQTSLDDDIWVVFPVWLVTVIPSIVRFFLQLSLSLSNFRPGIPGKLPFDLLAPEAVPHHTAHHAIEWKRWKKNAKLCEYPIICHSSRTHWNEKIIR